MTREWWAMGSPTSTNPRLEVVAGAGFTVQLLNAAGNVIGSAYQASSGTCLVTPSQSFADGVYLVRAMAVDIAGNVGPAGPGVHPDDRHHAAGGPIDPQACWPTDDSGTLWATGSPRSISRA